MVIKAIGTQKEEFIRFPLKLLSSERKAMVSKTSYRSGDLIPYHTHPDEQAGYVLSGIYLLRFIDVDEILMKGDAYSIPVNTEHSIEVLEGGEILEIIL